MQIPAHELVTYHSGSCLTGRPRPIAPEGARIRTSSPGIRGRKFTRLWRRRRRPGISGQEDFQTGRGSTLKIFLPIKSSYPPNVRDSSRDKIPIHHRRGRSLPIAEPVTTANARIGPAILDGASPPNRASSFEKSTCALVRARLTSEVSAKNDAFQVEMPEVQACVHAQESAACMRHRRAL